MRNWREELDKLKYISKFSDQLEKIVLLRKKDVNHRDTETNEKKMRRWARQFETNKKDEEMN